MDSPATLTAPQSRANSTEATAARPSRQAIAHAGFQLWLLNIIAGTLVGSLWLFRLPDGMSPWVRLYIPVALISSIAILGILPAIPFALIHRFTKRTWMIGWMQAATGAVFLGLFCSA